MKGTSRIKQFKNWHKLAKPHKGLFALSFSMAAFTAVCYCLSPIFVANVVTSITAKNYNAAMMWLAIDFAQIAVRQIAWHINYLNSERLIGYSYTNISINIYNKILASTDKNFRQTSKEKIMNIVGSDIYSASEFANNLSTKMSYFLRAIITVVIVFTSSPIAALIIILISIINFFLLNFASSKLGICQKGILESKDKIYERVSDIAEAREMIRDTNNAETYKNHYKNDVKNYVQARRRRSFWTSFINNWVYSIWQAIVCLTAIYLVHLISGGHLTLAAYLVIIGYLAPTIEKINNGYEIFQNLDVASVAATRIQTILDFTPKELVEYGNRAKDNVDGVVDFINVSVNAKSNYHTESVSDLKNASFNIGKGELALIVGQKGCGKRSIFHILRRAIKPDEGKVLLDGIDLYDYSQKVHFNNISYTTHKPFFFKGTIAYNLSIGNKNRKKMIEICKEVGLHTKINKLPNKYDSDMQETDNWSARDKYLLGLARALLFNSEVLMIYEFPAALPSDAREEVQQKIKGLANAKTVIVFASDDQMAPLANKVIYLSRGKITRIKENAAK